MDGNGNWQSAGAYAAVAALAAAAGVWARRLFRADRAESTSQRVLEDTVRLLHEEVIYLNKQIKELRQRLTIQQKLMFEVLSENHALRGKPPPNFDPTTDVVAEHVARARQRADNDHLARDVVDEVAREYPDVMPPRNGLEAHTVPLDKWTKLQRKE